ncbi:MAG: hypothetical protein HWN80_00565 [Candidatus Lokiarchaeota archaeon]|nr:hypothetical protein [Candidatus Lokiarchaeota archaeon]
MDNLKNLDDEDLNFTARELLSKVSKTKIKISNVLQDFFDFLLKIDEKEEIKWVEAEISGQIYEIGKNYHKYFKYRRINGYTCPVKYEIFHSRVLKTLTAIKNYDMTPFNYIPSLSIFELENCVPNTEIGTYTFSREEIELFKLNAINKGKIYFYFKAADINIIISNIREKINSYLVQFLKAENRFSGIRT